ncbi:MAG: 5-formyltetrahydrofolate cyclo-ligase [Pseudomarimonas sp.]
MDPADRPRLRADMRAARRALPARTRLAAAEAVAERLRTNVHAFSQPKVIAGYWACDGELPLHPLLAGRPPFTYLLPRLRADRCIDFVPWRPGDAVVANRFGIPEPESGEAVGLTAIDVILLPLLAFHRCGARLGSGGGYYDRSLASLAGAAPGVGPQLIGVGYALQEAADLRAEAWDVGLHHVVTEAEWIDCRSAGLIQTSS